MEQKLPSYGGQALIEGVMMRGTRVCAMAVRAPDQSIVIETQPLTAVYQSRIVKTPFLRGLIMLWDALVLGMRALSFSANMQVPEDEKIEGPSLAITFGISILFGLGFFMVLPIGAGYVVEKYLSWQAWQSNLLEGFVRLGLLLGYLIAIRRLPDIRRVYGYHGAEHKAINAFEDGAELTVEAMRAYPREHPRCGTAFLLTVVLLSILLFSIIGQLPVVTRVASRLLLLPVLASLAYEYIRFIARIQDKAWGRFLLAPNLWLQKLTTCEPDDDMLTVSIAAFEAMHAHELESVVKKMPIVP